MSLSNLETGLIAAAVAFLSAYDLKTIERVSRAAAPYMSGGRDDADPGGADDVALRDQSPAKTETPNGNAEAEKPAVPAEDAGTGTSDNDADGSEPGDQPAELTKDVLLDKFQELVPLGDTVETTINGDTKEVPAGTMLGRAIVTSFGVAKVRAIPREKWGDTIERIDAAIEGIGNGDDLDMIVAAVTGKAS